MLNVSKIFGWGAIFIFMIGISHAQSINDMDILGIHLGDDMKSSINKMPCSNYVLDHLQGYTFKIGSNVRCGQTKYGAKFLVEANHNGKIFSIQKIKMFSGKPNFEKIQNRIESKYGSPSKSNTKYGEKHFCYGKCTNPHGDLIVDEGLIVSFGYFNYEDYAIRFVLSSERMFKENTKWWNKKIKAIKNKNISSEEKFKF